MNTCEFCGITGPGVAYEYDDVTGDGLACCLDMTACNERCHAKLAADDVMAECDDADLPF